jgi:phage FluMu protein Com
MAKCPKCEEEIECLIYCYLSPIDGEYAGKGKVRPNYDNDPMDYKDAFRFEDADIEYQCPECQEILAKNEADADKVLGL